MPIYEYHCEKCGTHIEVIQKISDTPLKRCAKCRGKLEKTVSRTSFQLKGSGWYVTDYPGKVAGGKGASADTDKPAKVLDKKKAETVASTTSSGDSD